LELNHGFEDLSIAVEVVGTVVVYDVFHYEFQLVDVVATTP